MTDEVPSSGLKWGKGISPRQAFTNARLQAPTGAPCPLSNPFTELAAAHESEPGTKRQCRESTSVGPLQGVERERFCVVKLATSPPWDDPEVIMAHGLLVAGWLLGTFCTSGYASGSSRWWVKVKCPDWKRANGERWRLFEKPEAT
jgi:hypothetical protein